MSLKSRVTGIENSIPTRSECTDEDETYQRWMALSEAELRQKFRNYVNIYRCLADESIQTIEDVCRFVNAPAEDVRSGTTRGSGLSEKGILEAGRTREGMRRWPIGWALRQVLGTSTTDSDVEQAVRQHWASLTDSERDKLVGNLILFYRKGREDMIRNADELWGHINSQGEDAPIHPKDRALARILGVTTNNG